jgi:hypothetical protein
MPSLRELQRQFVDGLLADADAPVLPRLRIHGLPAAERFAIYRGNCREGFLEALRAGYPVLERLTGEKYFRQLVRDYQREHPLPSGNLYHAGAQLPAYLARRFSATGYSYFADVAALEWACQYVMAAPDRAALDPQRLAAVARSDYPHLRFELDPASALVRSPYPVVTIWEQHQADREPEVIDIGAGGEQAIVQRRAQGVVVCRLPPGEYASLAAFREARSLGPVVDAAMSVDPAFDLGAALRRWVRCGFIVDVSIAGESLNA